MKSSSSSLTRIQAQTQTQTQTQNQVQNQVQNQTFDQRNHQLPHPPGVPGSSAFLFLSKPDRKTSTRLKFSSNTFKNNSIASHADVLGNILGWRRASSRQVSNFQLEAKNIMYQELPLIFRPNNQSSFQQISISTSDLNNKAWDATSTLHQSTPSKSNSNVCSQNPIQQTSPFYQSPPTLIKSHSSDQLPHYHFNHNPLHSQVASYKSNRHHSQSISIAPHNFSPSNTSWFSSPHQTRSKQRCLSLPAMHTIFNTDSHSNLIMTIDSLNNPLSPRYPTMHGVASNESIRTAKPESKPIINPQPPPAVDHHSDIPSHHRFQNPRIFDLFTQVPTPDSTSPFRQLLSPELFTSHPNPSENSLIPSHPRSLGFSTNSSINSLNEPYHPTHTDLPLSMDPRFVIWAPHPATLQTQHSTRSPSHDKERSSDVPRQARHPASASTSDLSIDHSTGRITHLIPNHPSSVSVSPITPSRPKRWSRSGKNSSYHASLPESLSSSSPNLSTQPPPLPSTQSFKNSREELSSQVRPSIPSSDDDYLLKPSCLNGVLMAATIERWIAELTTQIDSLGLNEFFLTYRTIMKPNQLAQLLASRFEWSIMFRSSVYLRNLPNWNSHSSTLKADSEGCLLSLDGRCLVLGREGETLRRVAKVRTFVMIRHWLVHHFEDDFLHDSRLQTELHDWLENLTEKIKRVQRIISWLNSSSHSQRNSQRLHHQASFSGEDDLRILQNLRNTLRNQRLTHQQSLNSIVPSHFDSTKRQIAPLDRSKHKQHKFGSRELFNPSHTIVASEPESPVRRPPRSQTADWSNRPPSKGSLGHGRHRSANNLAQFRAANVSKSDLRLCELEHDDMEESGCRVDLENERQDDSITRQKLISKLKSIFESDTRRPRHTRAQKIWHETHHTPLSYSLKQNDSRSPKLNRNSISIRQHRISESNSVPAKQLITHQHRLDLSNPPSNQYQHGPLSFPQHHNPLQRYFTSTMGTIGRFKRMINNRSGPHMSSISVVNHHHNFSGGTTSSSLFLPNTADYPEDAFNNEIGDLLCVKGGLERYLSFFDIKRNSAYQQKTKEQEEEEDTVLNHHDHSTLKHSELRKYRPGFGRDGSDELNQSPGSPVVQYDGCFESRLSSSSSLSNSTCTTRSIPPDTDVESEVPANNLVAFPTNFFSEPNPITESTPAIPEHFLHGSISVETIKSESHPLTIPRAGMGLFKKQLRKKYNNKDMCPVLMRASMDESFSGAMSDPTSPIIRYSEDNSRMTQLSLSVPSPNNRPNSEVTSVQLDDLDAFDSDDELPVGVPKLRRFPGTADLKQAMSIGRKSFFNLKSGFLKANDDRLKRLSSETSSSVGTGRVPSIAASIFRLSKPSHRSCTPIPRLSVGSSIRTSCVPEMEENGNGAPAVVANFVADGLDSDDDEPGDVEAALRRLEGVIDADREKEKAKKVELQMFKSMQASKGPTAAFSQTNDTAFQYGDSSQRENFGDRLQARTETAEEGYSENQDEDDYSDEEVEDDEEEEEVEEEDEGDEEDEVDDYEEEDEEEEKNDDDDQEQQEGVQVKNRQSCRAGKNDREVDQQGQSELELHVSSLTEGDTRRSRLVLSDSVATVPFPSLPQIPSSTLPTLSSSKSPINPGSRSNMRFFTTDSNKPSLDQTYDRKIFRTNKKKLKAVRKRATDQGMPSIHKLFSASNEPSTQQLKHAGYENSNKRANLSTSIPIQPTPRNHLSPLLPLPPVHRSFLLDCRTEILAQQFCLIERDLLRNITWQELLLSKWHSNRIGPRSSHHHRKRRAGSRATEMEDGVVTCWETFMKQRAKEKMELKDRIKNYHLQSSRDQLRHSSSFGSETIFTGGKPKIGATDIHALIMRFNLTCNWVASELVLTFNLDERVALLGKFIRLAFKCYRQNNFQTLTQIIHGLQTPYIERLKKTWSKLGIWESRMFRDLKEFTSHLSNFKSLRNVQDSLINEPSSNFGQASMMNDLTGSYNPRSSHSHSRSSSSSTTACIPFLGLYLRDLTINDELPTYLDPTDPSVPVEIEKTTGRLIRLSNPQMIEGLPQLPVISDSRETQIQENSLPSLSKLEAHEVLPSDGPGAEPAQAIDSGYYPLININKLRNYAKIVLKIIEFQNRSIRNFNFETDSKWFITCLKINCLQDDQLKSLSLTCEP